MNRELKTRIRSFNFEWEMREAMMRLAKIEEPLIASHRREILHLYSLTEEEVSTPIRCVLCGAENCLKLH